MKKEKVEAMRAAMERYARKNKIHMMDVIKACVQMIGYCMSTNPTRQKGDTALFHTGSSFKEKDTWGVTVELLETANDPMDN